MAVGASNTPQFGLEASRCRRTSDFRGLGSRGPPEERVSLEQDEMKG